MKKIDWIRVKIWLPFVIFSTAVFIMTYMVAATNRAWQIENGIPPCNIEMAYPLQVIAYWVVMLVPAPVGVIGFLYFNLPGVALRSFEPSHLSLKALIHQNGNWVVGIVNVKL